MRTAIRKPRYAVAAVMAGLYAAAVSPINVGISPRRQKPVFRSTGRRHANSMPHQGPQEKARRVKQMEAGTHGY